MAESTTLIQVFLPRISKWDLVSRPKLGWARVAAEVEKMSRTANAAAAAPVVLWRACDYFVSLLAGSVAEGETIE